jgi:PEGA domain
MTRRGSMQRTVVLALVSCLSLLVVGCTPRMGIVLLDTKPQQATIYLGAARVGETPVTFELDRRKPVVLQIVKEGYVPTTEYLDADWVDRENSQGHYTTGQYVITGEKQRGFEVRTRRDLTEDPDARRRREALEENAKRLQEWKTLCDSMIGKDYHEVVNRLGLPVQVLDMPNGSKILIFDRNFGDFTLRFETDPRGKIIRWAY